MTMADTDPAAALLAQIREAEKAATEGPWRAVMGQFGNETFPAVIAGRGDPAKPETWLMAAGRGSPDPESNAQFAAMARTAMPRLLAAVEKVLEEHVPDRADPAWCGGCSFSYPCATVRAITAALTGERENESAHSAATREDGGS
jgi:hypothetical protein